MNTAFRRPFARVLTAAVICVVALLFAAHSAFAGSFASTDGACSVTAGEQWQRRQDKTSSAVLLIGAPGELYTNVWVEGKADFVKMDLPTFAKERVDQMVKNLVNGSASEAKEVTVGGRKGFQYEVRGEVDNLRIGYLYTVLEGDESYYRVLSWTTISKFNSQLPQFQEIVQSFKGK